MVYNRVPETKIAFEYSWSPAELVKIKDPVSGQTFSGERIVFKAEVGLGD